jgi:hypothetical protein
VFVTQNNDTTKRNTHFVTSPSARPSLRKLCYGQGLTATVRWRVLLDDHSHAASLRTSDALLDGEHLDNTLQQPISSGFGRETNKVGFANKSIRCMGHGRGEKGDLPSADVRAKHVRAVACVNHSQSWTTWSAVLTFVVNLYSPCQPSIKFEYTKTYPKRELFRFIRHVRWVTDYKD